MGVREVRGYELPRTASLFPDWRAYGLLSLSLSLSLYPAHSHGFLLISGSISGQVHKPPYFFPMAGRPSTSHGLRKYLSIWRLNELDSCIVLEG